MKKILSLSLLICLVLLLTTCNLLQPKAEFTITSWNQDYSSGIWGDVFIYYDITNTGSVDIDSYTVTFDVAVVDFVITAFWYGLGVSPGETHSEMVVAGTAGKQAISVTVSDYTLTSY